MKRTWRIGGARIVAAGRRAMPGTAAYAEVRYVDETGAAGVVTTETTVTSGVFPPYETDTLGEPCQSFPVAH